MFGKEWIVGGMLLDRPERIGFKPDEALVLLEHRNLKDEYNRYLETFIEFVNFMEKIEMNDLVNMTAIKRLVKIHNETETVTQFIENVINEYEPKVDNLLKQHMDNMAEGMLGNVSNPNRPLFSPETTKKILKNMEEITN